MTALHFHRPRRSLPSWAPVRIEPNLRLDPDLHTAAELMAERFETEREHLTDEALVVGAVRSWVDFVLPGDTLAANAAAGIALEQLAQTGSAATAFDRAREFVGSWMRHPSHHISVA